MRRDRPIGQAECPPLGSVAVAFRNNGKHLAFSVAEGSQCIARAAATNQRWTTSGSCAAPPPATRVSALSNSSRRRTLSFSR